MIVRPLPSRPNLAEDIDWGTSHEKGNILMGWWMQLAILVLLAGILWSLISINMRLRDFATTLLQRSNFRM